MKKFILLLLVLSGKLISFGQTTVKCSCQGIIDPDYKGVVEIYEKPDGKLKHTLKQDFKKEDFLVFSIDSMSSSYFHAVLSFPISHRNYTGWISKKKHVGVFPRAYSDTLRLYSKPDINASIQSYILPGNDALVQILKCSNKWTYIKSSGVTSTQEGWLRPEDQCSNPYTTCN